METNEMFSVENLTNCRTRSKWAPLVMYLLRDGNPQRHAHLKRQIDGISQKMLTQTLRQLEDLGFVSRTVYPTVPPTVEYQLTPHGTARSTSHPSLGYRIDVSTLARACRSMRLRHLQQGRCHRAAPCSRFKS